MSTASHIVSLWLLLPLAYCLMSLYVFLEGGQGGLIHFGFFLVIIQWDISVGDVLLQLLFLPYC